MVKGSAALMHSMGVLMSITHSTLYNDAMRHQQLPDMWPACGCSSVKTLSDMVMNKQVCMRRYKPCAAKGCNHCHHLPTQQGSLQPFDQVGSKNSLEGEGRGVGDGGGGGLWGMGDGGWGAQGYNADLGTGV